MVAMVDSRRAISRVRPVGLLYFAVTAVASGLGLLLLSAQQNTGPWGWVAALAPMVGLVYIGTGLLAWTRRPRNRMGPLLCAGGLLWLLTSGATVDNPVFYAVGLLTQTLPIAFVVHALLAYPSGRLRGTASWVLTVGIYVTAAVLQAPLYLFRTLGEGEPAVLWVTARPDIVDADRTVQAVAGLAILGSTGVVLVRRLMAADRQQRRVLLPIYATGTFVVIFVTSIYEILRALGFGPQPVVDVIQISIIILVPVAFVTGVLLGGFARTGELDELAEWLGSAGARPDVQRAVARVLGDPSVRLGYRFGEGWVDADGVGMQLPTYGSSEGASFVELDRRPVGAIIYDAVLTPDPAPVEAAGRVVAIALDRQRLTAQLLASQEELRESRTRLVQAGDHERRRLAQDLHDRLQGRLILLALRVGNASPGDDLVEIRRGLDESITELRWLVQGVMPALLLERGLTAAVEDLADRVPIRTVMDFGVDDQRLDKVRLPASVEGTAYAVVAEALTNAVKHSAASTITVSMQRDEATLLLQVADNGVGGARPVGGLGLRGMTDRIHALGGRLDIDSPPAGGTRVRVELPCAS
ncbi:MAG: sensor histidine kinase [Lapillicoccus sp.]